MSSTPEFSTLVADPPWPLKGGGSLRGGVGEGFKHDGPVRSLPLPYPTMTLDAIAALDVQRLAAADSHLYLWTTSGFLDAAFDVMRAWGFRYSTTLVWAKAPIGAGLGGAHGIATEFCLFGRRGGAASARAHQSQLVGLETPLQRARQAAALGQAARVLRHGRVGQPRPVPRAVRPRRAARMVGVGQSSPRGSGGRAVSALPALVEPITDDEVRAFRKALDATPPLLCEANGKDADRCTREAVYRAVLVPCGCGWLSCAECRAEIEGGVDDAASHGAIIVLTCVKHNRHVRVRWVEL